MVADVREVLGRRRVLEGGLESSLPMTTGVIAVLGVLYLLSNPQPGRSLTDLEVWLVLLPAVITLNWGIARIAFLLRMRRPWKFALVALLTAGVLMAALPWLSSLIFASRCTQLEGTLERITPFPFPVADPRGEASGNLDSVCRLTAGPWSLYRPGTLLRPAWRGLPQLLPWGAPLALLVAVLTALALRDRRVFRTRLAKVAWDALRLSPAAGSASSIRGASPANAAGWNACANPTLWGEVCGQLYPVGHSFLDGEPCSRCGMLFRPSPRLELAVVTLRMGDIDYLNTLESREARIWKQGEAQPSSPDTLEPRWGMLGEMVLPDVLTVSQALALIIEWIETLVPDDAGLERAALLARRQASRLAAWLWFHPEVPSMKRGIPTRDVCLATGTQRLRDLFAGRSGWKGIQLEIGLVPVDLHLGLWKPPEVIQGERTGRIEGQRFNNRQVFWLPVSAVALSDVQGGRWVPRVEGAGLRAWLTLTSREAHFKPAPYAWEGSPWAEVGDPITPHNLDRYPLGLVRLPLPEDEILTYEALLGCRLSEWDWLDRKHLELLRRQGVFMAPSDLSLWRVLGAPRPRGAGKATAASIREVS